MPILTPGCVNSTSAAFHQTLPADTAVNLLAETKRQNAKEAVGTHFPRSVLPSKTNGDIKVFSSVKG